MATSDQDETKPENVLVESLIIFGLIVLIKHMNNYLNKSKSIIPIAASVAIGYYIIMYVVTRTRPAMCSNIRNAVTWAAGSSLGAI